MLSTGVNVGNSHSSGSIQALRFRFPHRCNGRLARRFHDVRPSFQSDHCRSCCRFDCLLMFPTSPGQYDQCRSAPGQLAGAGGQIAENVPRCFLSGSGGRPTRCFHHDDIPQIAIAGGPAATVTASDISDIASAVWANALAPRSLPGCCSPVQLVVQYCRTLRRTAEFFPMCSRRLPQIIKTALGCWYDRGTT